MLQNRYRRNKLNKDGDIMKNVNIFLILEKPTNANTNKFIGNLIDVINREDTNLNNQLNTNNAQGIMSMTIGELSMQGFNFLYFFESCISIVLMFTGYY